ncbi:ABC transporter ATP-binding protein [Candidatus Pacearchaeota archaeon]|nr:MAG: ABC transporter ATP-binding protein [Candidatus Pacearchaeota archaeon]
MGWAVRRLAREEEERKKLYSDRELFVKVIKIFGYYKAETFSVIAMIITVSVFSSLIPIIMQRAIDSFIYVGISTERTKGIIIMASIYLTFILMNAALIFIRTVFFSKLGQKIIYRLRTELFRKLQYLSFSYFTETESGRTISKVTNDVDALGELLTTGLIDIFADFFSLIWIVAIMFSYDIKMTLLTFTVIPILIFVILMFQRKVRVAYRKTRVAIAKVTANLQESISGVKVTKALSREEENISTFKNINQENYKANVEAAGVSALFMPLIQFVSAIGTTIILIFGGISIIKFGTITIGELYAFLEYSNRFFMPIISLFTFYTVIQSGFAAAERIFEVLDEEYTVKNSENPIIPEKIEGRIEFRNVYFSYTPDVPILKNINLVIEKGESVALVGETGAGKTTMTKLLSRYYDVNEGELLIDEINIKDIELSFLRKNIAVVPQDVFLFSGTIIENLKYGKKEATDEEVYRVCKTLSLHKYILKLPEGYETDVKEGGSRLSLGQRQLISLARALIADPKILILDECSSSVDPITEALIQKGIDILLRNRTSIIIAHRLSTIKNASKIVVLDHGEIIEQGTHQELLKKMGKYCSLYETQLTANTIASEENKK